MAVTARVRVKFDGTNWVDISTYVIWSHPFTITAGRSDTDERVQPGRLSGMVLTNNDGRFTVGNTAGAYTPNVTSGKIIEVAIQDPVSTTYVPRFTGRIDGWPLAWEDNGSTCLVTISATDMLGDVARATFDPTAWLRYVLGGQGGYWPLVTNQPNGLHPNEATGTTYAHHPLVYSGGMFTTEPIEAMRGADTRPVRRANQASFGAVLPQSSTAGSPYRWQVGALVKLAAVTGTDPRDVLLVHRGTPTNPYPGVGIATNASGNYQMFKLDGAGTRTWLGSELVVGGISPLSWNVVQLTGSDGANGLTGFVAELDGQNTDGTARYAGQTDTTTSDAERLVDAGTKQVWIGHRAPSATADEGHFIGNAYAWDTLAALPIESVKGLPQSAAAAVGTLLTAYGGTTITTSDATSSYMWDRPLPPTVLEAAHQVDDVTGGATIADPSGTLRLIDGARAWSGSTLALTITAADAGPEWGVAADSTDVVNTLTVSELTYGNVGGAASVVDAASVTAHGVKSRDMTVYGTALVDVYSNPVALPGDARSLVLVTQRLARPTAVPRVPQFALQPLTMSDAQKAAILAADMWDQVGIIDLPTAGGWDTKWLGRVEGWSETVGAAQWDITINASFAGNRLGDATFGLILGSNRLG